MLRREKTEEWREERKEMTWKEVRVTAERNITN